MVVQKVALLVVKLAAQLAVQLADQKVAWLERMMADTRADNLVEPLVVQSAENLAAQWAE